MEINPRWLELPEDIWRNILQRLGVKEILLTAQMTCNGCPFPWGVNVVAHFFVTLYNRAIQLRHLRLAKCFHNFAGGLAKNFPLLEELHIYCTFITKEDIESIGRSCSRLKSFILNSSAYNELKFPLSQEDDDHALAIARSMPELRHLALVDNALTNVGLEAILDGCPHLESLDLCRCFYIDLEEDDDLGRRCRQQIVDLKQPYASTDDYEFDSYATNNFSSSDDGYGDDSASDDEDESW